MFPKEPMRSLREWKDMKVVRLVKFLAKILCLHPPQFISGRRYKILYWIYFSLFWIIGILANLHELVIRRAVFYSFLVTSMVILEAGFHVCSIVANVSASLDFIVLRRNSKIQIQAMLNKIERHCNRCLGISVRYDETKITKIFVISMTLVFCCIFLTTSYMMWVFGIVFNCYSMMTSGQFYIAVLIFQLYLDLFRVERMLSVMNRYLEEYLSEKVPVWTVSIIRPQKSNLKRFIDVYSEILDTFGRMNSLYGFHFLMIILNVAVMVLHFSNFSLKVVVLSSTIPMNPFTLITDAFLIVSYTGHGILITQICDKITEQVKVTVNMCYSKLVNLPSSPLDDEECCDKVALMLFADHLSSSNISFSASGLFTVNLTAFFMIFASIAMYLVIIPIDK